MTIPEPIAELNEKTDEPWKPPPRPGQPGIDYDELGAEMAPNARVRNKYVEETDKMDQELVDGWNKSLDNILLFAALFSAISTAFLIESSAIPRGAPLNDPDTDASETTDFTPSSSAVAVNTLWFFSLGLSVATPLIASLAKELCHSSMAGRVGSMLGHDPIRNWAEFMRAVFSTDRPQLVENDTPMDSLTSSMVDWTDSNLQGSPFYPVNDNRPRPFLQLANDSELLRFLSELHVPILDNIVWQLNGHAGRCGGYGYVEKALWGKQDVAVKFLRAPHTHSGIVRSTRSLHRELVAWGELSHPHILPCWGVLRVENYVGMVSPYMPHGSAAMYISHNPKADILSIVRDVASGLHYLAGRRPPIAHGDLKGANVLVTPNGRACICDFGLARFIKEPMSIHSTSGGTVRWMAPEQMRSETMLVSLEADVFSWGMLSLELMSGSVPWVNVPNDIAVIVKVLAGKRPERPTCRCEALLSDDCTCSAKNPTLWALIQGCWLDDPKERPTIHQLCSLLGC